MKDLTKYPIDPIDSAPFEFEQTEGPEPEGGDVGATARVLLTLCGLGVGAAVGFFCLAFSALGEVRHGTDLATCVKAVSAFEHAHPGWSNYCQKGRNGPVIYWGARSGRVKVRRT